MIEKNKYKFLYSSLIAIIIFMIATFVVIGCFSTAPDNSETTLPPDTSAPSDSEPPQETPSETEKSNIEIVCEMIASGDEEVYENFVYFIDANGNIIEDHVNTQNITSTLEEIASQIINVINSAFAGSERITNDMCQNNELANALQSLQNLLINNMK